MKFAMATDVDITRRRFTLDEYHRMGEAGILHEDDRVELIRGELIQMTAIGSRLAACVAFLNQRLVLRLGDRVVLWPQNPVVILPDSEPQPDIVLLKPRPDFYRTALPQAEDVLLLVEAADTSVRYDRNVKRPLYAEAGIVEHWIVNLEREVVEVHRQPQSGAYRHIERIGRGASVAPQAFSDVVLSVDDILG
jgi:Uma2 family endonuclease